MSIYQNCVSELQNLELLLNKLTCYTFEYLSIGDKHPNIENIKKNLHELIGIDNNNSIELIGISINQDVYYLKKKEVFKDIIDLYKVNHYLGTIELVGILKMDNKSIQLLNGENIV